MFKSGTGLCNGYFFHIFHRNHRMRISHRKAGHRIIFPAHGNFMLQHIFPQRNNRDLCGAEFRRSHLHCHLTDLIQILPRLQMNHTVSAAGFDSQRRFSRQPMLVHVFSHTADAVAAHRALRAVGVVHFHRKICCFGCPDQNQPVRADAEMAVTYRFCQPSRTLHPLLHGIYIDIIISAALHFCKTHTQPPPRLLPFPVPY